MAGSDVPAYNESAVSVATMEEMKVQCSPNPFSSEECFECSLDSSVSIWPSGWLIFQLPFGNRWVHWRWDSWGSRLWWEASWQIQGVK